MTLLRLTASGSDLDRRVADGLVVDGDLELVNAALRRREGHEVLAVVLIANL